jgi:hypothetical protein
MTFTILDWQIIEGITIADKASSAVNVSDFDLQRTIQLCFNIFPRIKTILHYFIENLVNITNLQEIFNQA